MRNQVKFLLGVLLITALSLFLIPDRGASGQQDVTSHDDATHEERFNGSEIVLPNGVGNPVGRGNPWLLTAKQDDDGDAEEDKAEQDGKDAGSTGFDRCWDVTCCG